VARGRGESYIEFLKKVESLPEKQLWRHNQAGDLVGAKGLLSKNALKALAKANSGKRGFTYTHYPVEGDTRKARHNRDAIREANRRGFTVNLSANNLEHADRLAELQVGPVTTLVPSTTRARIWTPAGKSVTICPAVVNDNITCSTCKLCANPDRKAIIGFPAHGAKTRKIDKILTV